MLGDRASYLFVVSVRDKLISVVAVIVLVAQFDTTLLDMLGVFLVLFPGG
jgi:hypothetical protein